MAAPSGCEAAARDQAATQDTFTRALGEQKGIALQRHVFHLRCVQRSVIWVAAVHAQHGKRHDAAMTVRVGHRRDQRSARAIQLLFGVALALLPERGAVIVRGILTPVQQHWLESWVATIDEAAHAILNAQMLRELGGLE